MSDLSDFKRIVHEPMAKMARERLQILKETQFRERALRSENRRLRAELDSQALLVRQLQDQLMERVQAPAPGVRDTSKQAARKVAPKAGTQHWKVMKSLNLKRQTDEQLVSSTGIQLNSLRPRRGELVKAGFVTELEGVTRPTKAGNEAVVWKLTKSGARLLARG